MPVTSLEGGGTTVAPFSSPVSASPSAHHGSELGVSMTKLGMPPEDTRDENQYERFFVLSMMDERKAKRKDDPDYWCVAGLNRRGWDAFIHCCTCLIMFSALAHRYWHYSYYPPKEGSQSSSPSWVASHYVSPEEMLTLNALHELRCEGAGQQPWDPAATFQSRAD